MIYYVGENRDDIQFEQVSIEEALGYFKDKQIVEVDTETEGFDPRTKNVICWQIGDKVNQYVINNKVYPLAAFKEFFEDDSKLFLFQNAKFDLRFFYHVGINIPKVYDTFLAERCLTLGSKGTRLALDALISRYCNVHTIDKTIRGQIHYRGLDNIVIDYAANDVRYLSEIREKQLEKAEKLGLNKVIDLENAFVRVLAYVEYCGMKLDINAWEKKILVDEANKQQILEELNKYLADNNLTQYLNRQLDMFVEYKETANINWNSDQQVSALFRKLGIQVDYLQKDGTIKTSIEDKFLAQQESKFPIISIYRRYTKAAKRCSTYGRNFYEHINPISGRLHTQFTQLMETGRLSSGGKDRATGKDNINFQNIPSDVATRSCFIPEKGNILVIADYSGQEQIILANQSQDKDLIHFYKQGLGDMHSYVASKLFPELKDVPLSIIKEKHKDKRHIAKSAGFAINYGGNGYTISQNLSISKERGEEVYNSYFKAFPGLDKYFKRIQANMWKYGYIQYNSLLKRKLFINLEWFSETAKEFTSEFWEEYRAHKEKDTKYYREVLKEKVSSYFSAKAAVERKALNYPIQGTGAEMTKIACIYFFNEIEKRNKLFTWLIPNLIHDEIMTEGPEKDKEEISILLKDCMERAGMWYCNIIPIIATPVSTKQWEH